VWIAPERAGITADHDSRADRAEWDVVGLGLLWLGGVLLISNGVMRLRSGDKTLGVIGILVGVVIAIAALYVVVRSSSLFD
jgi:hypothetical protein